ncbi:MAG: replication factor A, partial [Candidatus Aenigmatarchaeota archaeon]
MVEELVERISEESGEPEEEIREGAAHLVAREKGIELAEVGDKELKAENIVPGMNQVDLKCKVMDISEINTFENSDGEEGKVRNVLLGDTTGTVRMTLWNDQVDLGEELEEGENIHIKGAYSRENTL